MDTLERFCQEFDNAGNIGLSGVAKAVVQLREENARLRDRVKHLEECRLFDSRQAAAKYDNERVLRLRDQEENARLRAALKAQARLLVRAGVLRTGGIGGQTITGWTCGLCEQEQVSPSTAHGVLCDDCRREVIALAPAQPEEGKP